MVTTTVDTQPGLILAAGKCTFRKIQRVCGCPDLESKKHYDFPQHGLSASGSFWTLPFHAPPAGTTLVLACPVLLLFPSPHCMLGHFCVTHCTGSASLFTVPSSCSRLRAPVLRDAFACPCPSPNIPRARQPHLPI